MIESNYKLSRYLSRYTIKYIEENFEEKEREEMFQLKRVKKKF